ncbi:unnamed protein product [Boreogadus saida]
MGKNESLPCRPGNDGRPTQDGSTRPGIHEARSTAYGGNTRRETSERLVMELCWPLRVVLALLFGTASTGAWRASQPRLQFTHSGSPHTFLSLHM